MLNDTIKYNKSTEIINIDIKDFLSDRRLLIKDFLRIKNSFLIVSNAT